MKLKTLLNKINLPREIIDFILQNEINNITLINKYHRSGDVVINLSNKYILKISKNINRLQREKNANDILGEIISVSKSIYYIEKGEYAYYVKSYVKGKPLCSSMYLKNPKLLIKILAEAVMILRNVDISKVNSFFEDGNKHKKSLVHGDLCLPNILVYRNEVSGFIDTEGACVGDPWIDYAWSLWSLRYNLQTNEYDEEYLKTINVEMDNRKYDFYTKD